MERATDRHAGKRVSEQTKNRRTLSTVGSGWVVARIWCAPRDHASPRCTNDVWFRRLAILGMLADISTTEETTIWLLEYMHRYR